MAVIIGTGNPTSTNTTLAYEMFAGEVLAEFAKNTVAFNRIRQRTLAKGAKSASFPKLGTVTAGYHTAGDNIITTATASNGYAYDNDANKGENIIYADKLLLSSVLVNDLEEKILSWDARAEYSQLLGRAIAEKLDKTIMRVVALGSAVAADADYTGHPGGITATVDITTATVAGLQATALATGIPLLTDAIISVKNSMDTNGVPQQGRVLVVPPTVYNYLLRGALAGIATGLVLNKDIGGAGSMATGSLGNIAGIEIIMSNNLPFDNFSSTAHKLVSGEGNTYSVNGTATLGFAFQGDAVGMVKVADLAMEADYKSEYQASLLVAKMACGVNILRSEACARIYAV